MNETLDTAVTRTILDTYTEKMRQYLHSRVLIVGAGPAGMTAAVKLAGQGYTVTILEKRLASGGGIWGGGMAMNETVVQSAAKPLLDEMGIHTKSAEANDLYTVDAVELASGLTFRAVQAGAGVFNLLQAEDICLIDETVCGVVVNRTMIGGQLPVDPVTFTADVVIDATGHEAVVASALQRRRTLQIEPRHGFSGEDAMDAKTAEEFVVANTGMVYPGLWVAGMSVCAVHGGPRMGPIFGGMLRSGNYVAEQLAERLEG